MCTFTDMIIIETKIIFITFSNHCLTDTDMEANFLTSVVLPLSLAVIMLGMGLSLVPEDFQRVTKYPKAVAIGLTSQLIFLPVIGFIITKVVPMQPTIAMGVMIIALCA